MPNPAPQGAAASGPRPGLLGEFLSASRAVRRAVADVTVRPVAEASRAVTNVATAPLRDALATARSGADAVHEAVTGQPAGPTFVDRRMMRNYYGQQVVAVPMVVSGEPVDPLALPVVGNGPMKFYPEPNARVPELGRTFAQRV